MQTSDAQRAYGMSIGTIFFVLFGAAWLWLGLYNAGWLRGWMIALIVIVVLLLMVPSAVILRRTAPTVRQSMDVVRKAKIRRVFGVVNGIQWTAVFVASSLLARFHREVLIAPAIALIVGLHMFPLANLFEYGWHHVTGALLVLLAVLATWFDRTAQSMNVIVCVGAGIILWLSAGVETLYGMAAARRVAAAIPQAG